MNHNTELSVISNRFWTRSSMQKTLQKNEVKQRKASTLQILQSEHLKQSFISPFYLCCSYILPSPSHLSKAIFLLSASNWEVELNRLS
jgi:hypothetical protein